MFSDRLRRLQPTPIPRAPGVASRTVNLALLARFFDELLSGLPGVLMPTIRQALGLTYLQIGLLSQALFYVAAVVEPINGLLLDVRSRRRIMAFGAAGLGLAVMTMGVAPAYIWLLAGYVLYGLASGPLAHTGDVVLVEAHPQAPDRIYARATLVDTVGATLAPLLVAAGFVLQLGWRWLLLGSGLAALIYAVLILRARFPPPAGASNHTAATPLRITLRANLTAVLRSRDSLRWLLFLFFFEMTESAQVLVPVWLQDEAGFDQGLIGIYTAVSFGVGILSLLLLDRLLTRYRKTTLLRLACLGVLLFYPAWVLLPGVAARFLLALPLSFLGAFFWPIAKGEALASVPGRAGAVTAVHALIGLVPVPFLYGLLADRRGLTPVLLWLPLLGFAVMLLLTWFLTERSDS